MGRNDMAAGIPEWNNWLDSGFTPGWTRANFSGLLIRKNAAAES